MRPDLERPAKLIGVVDVVYPDGTFMARIWWGGVEGEAWFDGSRWPDDKRDLLIPGITFTIPRRRDWRNRPFHVVDRPLVTKRQIKKVRIEVRRLSKALEGWRVNSEPTEG